MEQYNPTCAITGKKENLIMKCHRNEKGEMVGWIFLHESLINNPEYEHVSIRLIPKIKYNEDEVLTSEPPIMFQPVRLDHSPHG